MIYFLQPIDGGPIKIGFSDNPDLRRRQLEASYGQPLALLGLMEGGREEERVIHQRFVHLRFGRTEQFQPAPELMKFIGRPLFVNANPVVPMEDERVTIINLKGTQEFAAWLEDVHRKTHIPKATIVRLGLTRWAEENGHPTPPEL